MKSVVVLQPVLAHYRKSVFSLLSEWEGHDVHYIAGDEYLNIKSLDLHGAELLSYLHFSILGHTFYYLRGSIRGIAKLNPDIIISSGIDPHLIHTLVAFIYFRLFRRVKFCWWSHAGTGNQGKFGIYLRQFFYKRASGILTYSVPGSQNLEKWGIPKTKIRAIGNALNTIDYGYLNHNSLDRKTGKTFTILFIGRIHQDRKLEVLIRAVSLLKRNNELDITVKIIGNGNVENLCSLARTEGILPQLIFTGALYGDEAAEHLLTADLVVYPRYIGLSILHAFSYGIPVITSDNLAKQMPEIELLSPGETGDFYREDDAGDLAKMIRIWQKKILNQRDTICEKCIQRIIEMEYLPEILASKIKTFIRLIISS